MKREIKFRAWRKSGKSMHSWPSLSAYIAMHCDDVPRIFEGEGDGDLVLMQFTGLKDKNGVEIYEGDIVRAWSQGSCGTFQIYWRQGGSPSWILYPAFQNREMWHLSGAEHKPGKQFISLTGEVTATDKEGFFDEGVEVIGNIYENPELIQSQAAIPSS